jgi:hypothetical protein
LRERIGLGDLELNRTRLVLSLLAIGVLMSACHRTKDMDGKIVKVAGSYAKTCHNVVELAGGAVSAECKDALGQLHTSTIQRSACEGDLANINGVLFCPGAPPAAH